MLETAAKRLARVRNALLRRRHRLPRGAVFAGAPNALYRAHLSIYAFAARFAVGKRVLVAGCGSGYGAAYLARHGAAAVVASEDDHALLAYARAHAGAAGVDVVDASPATLVPDPAAFDLAIVTRLAEIEAYELLLDRLTAALAPGGHLVAAVPPIGKKRERDASRAVAGRRHHFYVWYWQALLEARFASVRFFRHRPPAGVEPDFGDPRRSPHRAEDYRFLEEPAEHLVSKAGLTAVFLAADPR